MEEQDYKLSYFYDFKPNYDYKEQYIVDFSG